MDREMPTAVRLRAKPGVPVREALMAVAGEMFGFDVEDGHLVEHRHRWSADRGSRSPDRAKVRASCQCGIVCVGVQAWAEVDRDAYETWVDPLGWQRAFMAATGLR